MNLSWTCFVEYNYHALLAYPLLRQLGFMDCSPFKNSLELYIFF